MSTIVRMIIVMDEQGTPQDAAGHSRDESRTNRISFFRMNRTSRDARGTLQDEAR
ncbi:hypothetical protein VAWG007_02860 [Aeromonas enteropelogenes]|nr:hypothetical protein VAWG007_02860 [Aeromonas enteropelogenes]